MITRIGLLLSRSTDYPAMANDIVHGLQCRLANDSGRQYRICTENIGFGEDYAVNYAKAEKLVLQESADMLIAYCNSGNAEALFPLADALNKPLIILDAG